MVQFEQPGGEAMLFAGTLFLLAANLIISAAVVVN